MKYEEYLKRRNEKFNKLPMRFAFNKEQLEEVKKELNASLENKLTYLGSGTFILSKDVHLLEECEESVEKEFKEEMKNYDFVLEAFNYELANHEFGVTYDINESLESLGLTLEEVNKNETYKKALRTALEKY